MGVKPSTAKRSGRDTVLVLDFGAQYAQLIARRVREARVFSEIVPGSISARQIERRKPKALILSGGPASVYQPGAPECDPEIFDLGIPVLGICYGHQLMAQALGAEVERGRVEEYGRTHLTVVSEASVLFGDLPARQSVWMSHSDAVVEGPKGFDVTASTPHTPVAAMEYPERGLYGVQFHPEVSHTTHGQDLLKRFLYKAVGLRPNWNVVSIIDSAVEAVEKQVGDASVVCALSGGVDSAVAAALVYKAIGSRLTCVFVDHGLLREGEARQVERSFRDLFGRNLIPVHAGEQFLSALEGVTDPEEKRKIIGKTFIDVFEKVCQEQLDDTQFLVQGTIYPDWIESGGGGKAAGIKSHHNVGGLPDVMKLKLVEPLRELFKDEVRRVGTDLGLPDEIIMRQPFPGPGLAVRILGPITGERLALLRGADLIVQEELAKRDDLDEDLWQAFAVLPGFRSVGVQGDGRTYGEAIVVRAVTSLDAMTADWARLPHDLLDTISRRIVNEVRGVNRVLYDVTSKPPATIEYE
ncbi:MAG: glutamine-hydrolyzing GMP synthase [Acidimicrobiales bacterium]|nr:glutamine-hydrolyzing GMP synthase [Acidimicrobiales bacterium]